MSSARLRLGIRCCVEVMKRMDFSKYPLTHSLRQPIIGRRERLKSCGSFRKYSANNFRVLSK
jgi:hypothetical protein